MTYDIRRLPQVDELKRSGNFVIIFPLRKTLDVCLRWMLFDLEGDNIPYEIKRSPHPEVIIGATRLIFITKDEILRRMVGRAFDGYYLHVGTELSRDELDFLERFEYL